jgi:hypothetical protein
MSVLPKIHGGKFRQRFFDAPSMIEIRRLHPSEFDLLKTFSDGFMPPPDSSVAVVVENAGRIIGRIFLVSPVHVEAPFVERPWRNGPVFKRLVDAIEIEARAEGVKSLLAFAADEQMAGYIERLGYTKMPLTVYGKDI